MKPRVLVLVIALVGSLLTALPAAAAGSADHTELYVGPAGVLGYQVHVPAAQAAGKPLPVVVALHGCTMSGYGLNSMKDLTNLNQVSDEEGFLVVYPTQDFVRGLPVNCWSGLLNDHQHRGHGEPALIAAITEQVIAKYGADRARVHVLGASSGAGLAVIMAVTYPDVYATVMSAAGAEYAVNEVDLEHLDEIGPVDTAKRAWAQMGRRARVVPALIVQGDQDTTVKPFLADRLVTHWAAIDDLAIDGQLDGDVDDVADQVQNFSPPNAHPYTLSSYRPRAGGVPVIEKLLVNGMGHAWPGPGSGVYADHLGPDLAKIWWSFAASRKLS